MVYGAAAVDPELFFSLRLSPPKCDGGESFPTGLVFLRTFMDNARPVTICVYSHTHTHTYYIVDLQKERDGYRSLLQTIYTLTLYYIYICYIVYIATAARHIRSNIYNTSSSLVGIY